MANAQNIRPPNQRPGHQIKERYRGCKRVGRDRHARPIPALSANSLSAIGRKYELTIPLRENR
jgi:hypothetical protein